MALPAFTEMVEKDRFTAFYATMTRMRLTQLQMGKTLVYNDVILNHGSMFSATSGVFTISHRYHSKPQNFPYLFALTHLSYNYIVVCQALLRLAHRFWSHARMWRAWYTTHTWHMN